MRRRRFTALVLAGAAASAGASGCGGSSGEERKDPLAWTAAPQVFRTDALPNDRVAMGTVRNTTGEALELDASALRIRDADGRLLRSTGQFAAGYAHGLYGAFQKPDPVPPGELARLGKRIVVGPGATAPLAVSWSIPRGADTGRPATVDYGPGRLTLPTRVRKGVS